MADEHRDRISNGSQVGAGAVAGYLAGRIIPGLLILVSLSLWLRIFSAEAYGVFSVVQAAVLVGSALFTGWLRQANLRFTGRPGHGLLDHPAWVLLASVLGVVGTAVGTMGLVAGWSFALWDWLSCALFAGTYAVYLLSQVAVQRDSAFLRFNLAEVVRVGGALALSLSLGELGAPPILAIILGNALGNVAGLMVNRRPRVRPMQLDRGQRCILARESWRFGWPLSIWLGVASLTAYVDRFVLGLFAAPEVLGRYTATADLAVRGLTMIALPIVMAVHPVVMREHNAGRAETALALLRRWQIRLLLVLGSVVVLTGVLGPQLLQLVLGEPTVSTATLVVLAAGAALIQYSPLAHKRSEIAHRTKALMTYAIIALAVEVGGSFLLVRPLGPLGVATGMLAGSAVYLTLVWNGQRGLRQVRAGVLLSVGGPGAPESR
jgi:O-antigen/teichoic acid export membrane protein